MVTFEAATKKLLYDMGHPRSSSLFLVTNKCTFLKTNAKFCQYRLDGIKLSLGVTLKSACTSKQFFPKRDIAVKCRPVSFFNVLSIFFWC